MSDNHIAKSRVSDRIEANFSTSAIKLSDDEDRPLLSTRARFVGGCCAESCPATGAEFCTRFFNSQDLRWGTVVHCLEGNKNR